MPVVSPDPVRGGHSQSLAIPVVDLSWQRALVLELIVRACEKCGFFKVINHGVPVEVMSRMEAAALEFFALPDLDKQHGGPPNPLGYGSRAIGPNGDTGEVEYLILPANPSFVSQGPRTISMKDPTNFSCVVTEYVKAVKGLACEILELLAEGLEQQDTGVFSRLIRDVESDSLLRLNHYPPCPHKDTRSGEDGNRHGRIGFGEHSDPQIISLLRSNDVEGLQILLPSSNGAVWVPVLPDPTAIFVNVGDILQVMTNGRLVSVRHRAMANPYTSRLSIVYFGAPPIHSHICPLPEMITPQMPRRYKSFTWGEYKEVMYSTRLSNNRLHVFQMEEEDGDAMVMSF